MHHQGHRHEWSQEFANHVNMPRIAAGPSFDFEAAYQKCLSQGQEQIRPDVLLESAAAWEEEFAKTFHDALSTNIHNHEHQHQQQQQHETAWNDAFKSVTLSTMTANHDDVAGGEAADQKFFDHMHQEYDAIWKQAELQQMHQQRDSFPLMSTLADIPMPDHHSYTFPAQNPYCRQSLEEKASSSNNKTIEEWEKMALQLYGKGEPVLATYALEACIQEHSTAAAAASSEMAHIWDLLGTWQSENENEVLAMAAFESCLKLDPNQAHAIQNLAICYTNEGLYRDADMLLARWLKVTFPTIPIETDSDLIRHFTKCLAQQPRNADLQMALGVLFYHRDEMDKAIDCFKTALSITPQDYRLWNRLGATLANSNQSEEAIKAYEKALTLNPSYIRARCNLGVSCMHMGMMKQAIEHFLAGLLMQQEQQQQNGSSTPAVSNRVNLLWIHLRRALEMSEQYEELHFLCQTDQVPPLEIFRKFFDF